MSRGWSVGLILCVTGCNIISEPSNVPDSGIVCSAVVPQTVAAGSATLSGPAAFAVAASYESRLTDVTTQTARLHLALYGRPVTCAALGGSGTVQPGPAVFANLYSPPGTASTQSTYPVGDAAPADGGWADVYQLGALPDGGGLVHATSGTVSLNGSTACSVSGTFTATFAPDGGVATVLSGSFSSAYCQ